MQSLFLTEKLGHPDKGDTNLLIKKSIEKGLDTFIFEPQNLILENNILKAPCVKVVVKNDLLQEIGERISIEFNKNILAHIRLNPPFDSHYFTLMQLLAHYNNGAKIYNNPLSIINLPEKIIPDFLLKFTPNTLISSNINKIKEYWKTEKDIVLKPLYEFAGRSVFRLKENEENSESIFQFFNEKYNEPIIVQKYIPEVKQGDKRIVLLDGEFIGCFNRIPPENQLQAAIARGGSFEKSSLTARETEICNLLKPYLKEKEILICGLDTIGDHLTEINVTCPAGMIGLKKLYNIDFAELYWNFLLKKIS